MNTLQRDKRRSRRQLAQLECLDDRIVPSTIQPHMGAVAEVMSTHASVISAQQKSEETAAAESRIQIRHENRMIKLEERREARLAKLTARREFSPAIVDEAPTSQAAATTSKATTTVRVTSGGSSQPSGGSASSGSGTGSTSGSTGSGSTTTVVATLSETTSTTTNPLPINVSVPLNTVYEEYMNGDLPTGSKPGQVEIEGTNVGVVMRSSNSSDFETMVASAESLGLQVSTESAAYDTVVGFLPIAELPAAAQIAGSPVILPLMSPIMN